jgi:DNA-binding transcriptional ArsR family regulator
MSRRSSAAAVAKLEAAAPVFAALGDATRARLVARLSADGPLSISRLTEGTGVTRQAITKHLGALSEAGLVRDIKNGRERVFELEPRRLEKARQDLDRVSADWEHAIGRLKEFVEKAQD